MSMVGAKVTWPDQGGLPEIKTGIVIMEFMNNPGHSMLLVESEGGVTTGIYPIWITKVEWPHLEILNRFEKMRHEWLKMDTEINIK